MRYLSFSLLLVVSRLCGQNVVYIPSVSESVMNAKTINTSLAVGVIAGSASVSSIGAAMYNIPLALPPATNGFGPSLALVYNSNSGDGPLGLGWNLTGSSAISRVGADHYHDELFRAVSNSPTDFFALDGQRLVPTNGLPYGAADTEYDTEVAQYLVVQVPQFEDNEPAYFKVVDKSGITSYYGLHNGVADGKVRTADGTRTISWLLTLREDPFGNQIKYNYLLDGNEPRLASIHYDLDADPSVPHVTAVILQYRERSDVNVAYVNGTLFRSSRLLTRIVIESTVYGGLHEYQLDYAKRELSRSFLSEIKERGLNGEELNSTIFRYGDDQGARSWSIDRLPEFSGQTVDLYTGDFDGNGVDDILAAVVGYAIDGTVKVCYGFKVYITGSSGPPFTYAFPPSSVFTIMHGRKQSSFACPDIDGDGRDDILLSGVIYNDIVEKWQATGIHAFISQSHGSVVDFDHQVFAGPPNPYTFYMPEKFDRGQVGDFDGDGRFDFAFFGTDNNWNVLRGYLWTYADGWVLLPALSYGSAFSQAERISVIDINGDGQTEVHLRFEAPIRSMIMRLNPSSTDWEMLSLFNGPPFIPPLGGDLDEFEMAVGDFNGDGNQDVLYQWQPLTMVFLSTGSTFLDPILFNWDTPYETNNSKIVVADFNGDGRSDIFHGRYVSGAGHQGSIAWSQGTPSTSSVSFEWTTTPHANAFLRLGVGDMNGDGRMDLLNRHYYQLPVDVIMFGAFVKERCLFAVKDGLLNTIAFEYSGVYDTGVHTIENVTYAYPKGHMIFPLNLVKKLWQPNGTSTGRTTLYSYANGLGWKNGPGFNGFHKVIGTDALSLIVSTDEYSLQDHAGLFHFRSEVVSPGFGVLYRKTSNNGAMSFMGPMKRYVPFVSEVTEFDGLRFLTSLSSHILDQGNGNLLSSTTTIPGIHTITETYSFGSYGPLFPSGYNNRMTQRTLTSTRSGEVPHVDVHEWEFDNYTGALIKDRAFANSSSPIIKEITVRTARGEVEEEGVYFVGQEQDQQRWNRYTYDPIRLGPVTIRTPWYSPDGVVQVTSHSQQVPARSGPEFTIGTDGLRVDYLYDGFGRVAASSAPSEPGQPRYWKYIHRVWDITTVPNAVYYLETVVPGAPGQREYFDALGRSVQMWTQVFSGSWSKTQTVYDGLGRVHRTKEPSLPGGTEVWTDHTYDELDRLTTVTHPLQGTTTTSYSYANGLLTTTTVNADGRWSAIVTDAVGAKVESRDEGGVLTFRYNSRGLLTRVTKAGVTLAQITYDDYGNRSSLQDPAAGYISYNNTPLGKPLSTYSANGQLKLFTHDNLGRLIRTEEPEGVVYISYEFDGGSRMSDRIVRKEGFGVIDEYDFNELGLLTGTARFINEMDPLTRKLEYDEHDRLVKTSYGEVAIRHDYGNGYLAGLIDEENDLAYWKGLEMDAWGRFTHYALQDGIERREYDGQHLIRTFDSGNFDMRYAWEHSTGDLRYRWDAKHGLKETFYYDDLDRLTAAKVQAVDGSGTPIYSVSTNDFTYDGQLGSTRGDLVRKEAVGQMPFYNASAVTAMVNGNWPTDAYSPPAGVNLEMQRIDYTSYHQPSRIREPVGEAYHTLTFQYGPDHQRALTTSTEQTTAAIELRMYDGDHERQKLPDGTTNDVIYVNGGTGLCAMIVITNGYVQRYAVHTDHLGSPVLITRGQSGQVQVTAKQSFDPWGRPRNPETWALSGVPVQPAWLYRGFTGHEHLAAFALINMNGRLYDPMNGRMLSVDEFVQGAFGSQGFNRYSYAANNPLKYTDPSGEVIPFIAVVGIVGVVSGGINWYANRANINNFWDGLYYFSVGATVGAAATVGGAALAPVFGTGALAGAIFGGASGFVAGYANNVYATNDWGKESFSVAGRGALWGAVTGGLLAGGISLVRGANFWTGAPVVPGHSSFSMSKSSMVGGPSYKFSDTYRLSSEFWKYGYNRISFGPLEVSNNQPLGGWERPDFNSNMFDTYNGRVVINPEGVRTNISIPPGFESRLADNGAGWVFQPPGATGNSGAIRIMWPTANYPNGYAVFYNSGGQPINPNTGQTLSKLIWHFSFP